MAVVGGVEDAIELRRWRRDAGITRPAAAADLGISERMLAYYEAGGHRVARAILLAARARKAGLDNAPGGAGDARERWVVLVRHVVAYGRGEPVVGRMLRERDRRGIADFLAFVKKGPDPHWRLPIPRSSGRYARRSPPPSLPDSPGIAWIIGISPVPTLGHWKRHR